MSALDQALSVVKEATYGTPVTTTRFFEYESENIAEVEGRTEGDPLRNGTWLKREDRFLPYFSHAAGTVQVPVYDKGFGFWLEHLVGAVATSGTGPYTHTGTLADLYGKSFTAQVSRPFHPSGTVQAFTYSGGKVTKWTLTNSVDGLLLCDIETVFSAVSTAIAAATPSYPTGAEPLTWAGGVVTIGGTAYDVTEVAVSCDNDLAIDRRQIRGNTAIKEPTGGRRAVEFSISADFDSLTQRNRAHAAARADALASFSAKWTFGANSLEVVLPKVRFDAWAGANAGPEGISQTLTGVGTTPTTGEPISLIYTTADATP